MGIPASWILIIMLSMMIFARESETLSVTFTYEGIKETHLDRLTVARFDRIPEEFFNELKKVLPSMKYSVFPSLEASPALVIFQLDWDCFPESWKTGYVSGGPLFSWVVRHFKDWLEDMMERRFEYLVFKDTLDFYPKKKQNSDL
jgi:hypothetical protein